MDASKVLNRKDDGYDVLRRAAALLTAKSPNGYTYYIGETWEDYGAGIRWTTILCDRGFQALCPREWDELVIFGKDLDLFAKEHFADKWCADHK